MRIGLIGLGRIGAFHAETLSKLPSVTSLVPTWFLATYVVAQRPSLGQVQIHQDEPGAVVYRIVPGPSFDPVVTPGFQQRRI